MPTTDPDTLHIHPGSTLRGTITLPGDKSISHRAVMFGALAAGTSCVRGWLPAGDTLATLSAVRALGVPIERVDDTTLVIHGGEFAPPDAPLYFANAGTGLRLMAGIMAGQPFPSILDGSEQLRRRPMRRITDPLRLMGAQIDDSDGRAPLRIGPAALRGINYPMTVASGQVKSALLLAGLFANGPTTVIEPGPARDHTERMLRAMGAAIVIDGPAVTLTPGAPLQPLDLTVPGDPSSLAFPLVAGCLLPGEVTIEGVSLNPTRTGLLEVLGQMGASLAITQTGDAGGDPVGQIVVKWSRLTGVEVAGETVVRMIDEFPALMIAALLAEGETRVRDARELRVKETDRIAVMAGELRKMGAVIEELPDGFLIVGPQRLRGAAVRGHDDHRVAMSLAVAGLAADGETRVDDAGCAADSFPGFAAAFRQLGGKIS